MFCSESTQHFLSIAIKKFSDIFLLKMQYSCNSIFLDDIHFDVYITCCLHSKSNYFLLITKYIEANKYLPYIHTGFTHFVKIILLPARISRELYPRILSHRSKSWSVAK